MKLEIKHILLLYLFILFAGTLFFIPPIFVNRFTTAPALWMQAWISIGILYTVWLAKERVPLPPKGFVLLIITWVIYHIWQNQGNIDNGATFITILATFFLFHFIWGFSQDKKLLFILFTFLALLLSLWGMAQYSGFLPSFNNSFTITGPFDNPAGISASLVVLLPFSLYCCRYSGKKHRLFAIIVAFLTLTVIILSHARTAILATVVISIFFLFNLLKERDIKLGPVHYAAIIFGCLLFCTGLFFMKKDSASGRLLIWQNSIQLVLCKPVSGYGGNGFTANYMGRQASYFTKNPESKYAMLADNIRHPFNEFLKWAVNYGLTGLSLTLLLAIIPLWVSRKEDSPELFFIRLSLLAAGVCAFFSYPFNYPFLRLMVAALLAFLLASRPRKNTPITNGYLSKGIALIFSLGLISATAYQAYYEREWHVIANKSLKGWTIQMLPRYRSLYTHLRHKDLFLYNYAAELNVMGQYGKSLQIALKCNNLWVDYDLQMLMADNCSKLKQYDKVENHLKKAAAMCPVKFMPLYLLVELYTETGRKEDARALAQKILEKEIKIPSAIIHSIKHKMKIFLNEQDNSNGSPRLINHDMKSTTSPLWQDCLLDHRIPRALLPT